MKIDRSELIDERHSAVRTYVPDARFSATSYEAIRALFKEVWGYRSHVANMFSSDFRSSYRGTMFGIFWNFALPLVPLTVYIFLVNLRVFPRHDGLAPAIFIGFNVTIWSLMTGMITRPIQVLKSRNKESMKTSLPISVSIAASFGQLCFDTLVRLGLLLLMMIYFAQWPHLNIFGFAGALLVGMVFSLSLGLILAVFNVIIPDTSRVVTILLQYGIFMSGVIFPLTSLGGLVVLEKINPFAAVIKSSRDFLFTGRHSDSIVLLIWGGIAFIVFMISMRFFYVMERRIRGID